MNVTLKTEQSYLLKVYDLFSEAGYIVERVDRTSYNSIIEVAVRLYDKQTKQYTPVFRGQYAGMDQKGLVPTVHAEIVALMFAAKQYGVSMDVSVEDSTPELAVSSHAGVNRYSIINEMGNTVADVEMRMYALGVDMSGYETFKTNLGNQGKRVTKERMADYFCPEGGRSVVKFKKSPDVEQPKTAVSYVVREFIAER